MQLQHCLCLLTSTRIIALFPAYFFSVCFRAFFHVFSLTNEPPFSYSFARVHFQLVFFTLNTKLLMAVRFFFFFIILLQFHCTWTQTFQLSALTDSSEMANNASLPKRKRGGGTLEALGVLLDFSFGLSDVCCCARQVSDSRKLSKSEKHFYEQFFLFVLSTTTLLCSHCLKKKRKKKNSLSNPKLYTQ